MDCNRVIQILRNELECVNRDNCDRACCAKCDLVMDKADVVEALNMAIDSMKLLRGINKPLTREEMRTIKRPIYLWAEERKKQEIELYEFRNILPFHVRQYNRAYRFWIEKPTEQERAAYEWEG